MKKEGIEQENSQEIGRKELFLKYCFFNQRKILGWTALVLVVSILTIVFATIGSGPEMSQKARATFEQWKKTPRDELLTKEMQRALEKAPGLRRALEAEIVQVLLSDGSAQGDDSMAAQCIERLQEDSPLHAQFAQASLLIEQKEFQKALEISVTLKERLESMVEQSGLYGWNLLRLAFLHKQLQNPSGELAAWEEVKTFMQKGELMAGKFFEMGIGRADFSLSDFIAYREREIAP
jgi:hypothetical protein